VLRGEMEHPDEYFIRTYSLTLYGAENRYCTILVTVQWCQYFDNIYNVMDSDMRENLEHSVDVGVTVIDHDTRSDSGV
jgi:hypothetical protein